VSWEGLGCGLEGEGEEGEDEEGEWEVHRPNLDRISTS
jgi:hypothetical protein